MLDSFLPLHLLMNQASSKSYTTFWVPHSSPELHQLSSFPTNSQDSKHKRKVKKKQEEYHENQWKQYETTTKVARPCTRHKQNYKSSSTNHKTPKAQDRKKHHDSIPMVPKESSTWLFVNISWKLLLQWNSLHHTTINT